MKASIALFVLFLVLSVNGTTASGQGRTTRSAVKPAVPAPTPAPRPAGKAVPPAEALFNEGLKCPTEDHNCQVSNFTKAINLGLTTKEVFEKRGNAYLQRKDFDKAIADFTKLIELDPNNTSGYKNRGNIYLERATSPQSVNAAIRDFTSAIDLEPKDKEALILRSKAHFTAGNNEKGLSDLDSAVQLDPTNTSLLIFQGRVFSSLENYDKAIDSHSKVISNEPNNIEAFTGRAKVYEIQKKNDLAIKDYSKATNLDPENPVPIISLAGLFEKNNNFDEAIREFTRAINLTPTNSDFLLKRAAIYRKFGKMAEASADITKVIELSPRNAKAYEIRCSLNEVLKNYKASIEDCSTAISLDPDLDDAYLLRYDLLKSRNDLRFYWRFGYLQRDDYISMNKELYPDLITGAKNARINAGVGLGESPDVEGFIKLASAENRLTGLMYSKAAIDNFSKAIEFDPNSSDAYAGRCQAKHNLFIVSAMGTSDLTLLVGSLQDCQTALSINPSNPKAIQIVKSMGTSEPILADSKYEQGNLLAKLKLKVFDAAVLANPNDMGLLILRAKQRHHFIVAQSLVDAPGLRHSSARIKAELRLKESNWQGFPRGIEADFSKAIELFGSSDKSIQNRRDLASAAGLLSAWFQYYRGNDKEDPVKGASIFDDAIAKYPDVLELRLEKCPPTRKGCEKEYQLLTILNSEMTKDIMELRDAMKNAEMFARALPSGRFNERSAEDSHSKRLLREREIRRVALEDADAQKKTAEQAEQASQERSRLDLARAAEEQRLKERKLRRDAETMNALFGLITTTAGALSNNRRPTPQTTQPTTASRPQTPQTAGTSTVASNPDSDGVCVKPGENTATTNTGAAEPGTQKEYAWGTWQNHPGYRGIVVRTRAMFQQKGQPYWYFEMEVKNNYAEAITVNAFTSDKCKMRNSEINEIYSDGSVLRIPAGGTGKETYLRSASSSTVKYWITMWRNDKIARHDDGSVPIKCQVYPNDQFCTDLN